jgi:DNA adenine methylase
MKTPITYYGGKQNMITVILPLIPAHKIYCEPFFGGGAIFFAKEPAQVEVINDTNSEVVNFYRMIKNDFTALEKEIRISLHSRDLHRQARVVYQNPDMFSEIKRAWAFWVLANQSFMSSLGDGWAYEKQTGKKSAVIAKKRDAFTEDYAIRLQNVQIECADAIRIINCRDSEQTFFYLDPPYYNADMGHYDGYTLSDFTQLLELLTKLKGKFLLSSYRSDILKEFTKANGWHALEIRGSIGIRTGKSKTTLEVLTANFSLK